MIADSATFFDKIRPLFTGHMSDSQVQGVNAILTAWDAWLPHNVDLTPNERWLAYQLATVFHETAASMQPIAEWGKGRGRPYGLPDPITHQIYYGRGLVQLTGRANYEREGTRLSIDLLNEPDRALEPAMASDIALNGMACGHFTGKRLGEYFGAIPAKDDPTNARRIINGTDRAALVAGYHRTFAAALTAGGFTMSAS